MIYFYHFKMTQGLFNGTISNWLLVIYKGKITTRNKKTNKQTKHVILKKSGSQSKKGKLTSLLVLKNLVQLVGFLKNVGVILWWLFTYWFSHEDIKIIFLSYNWCRPFAQESGF